MTNYFKSIGGYVPTNTRNSSGHIPSNERLGKCDKERTSYPLVPGGNRLSAGEEWAVNQRGSGFWRGYVGVLLWVGGMKYVSGYHGGVRKMNVLSKDIRFMVIRVNWL